MSCRKYTIVCEFRGGTYVSQVFADDVLGAVEAWTGYLASERPIPRVSTHLAKAVGASIGDNPPIALEGLTGVWCFCSTCGGDLMLANVVETADAENGS
jgi:hypothetical protein